MLFISPRFRLTIWMAVILVCTFELLGMLGLWYGSGDNEILYQRQNPSLTLLAEINELALGNHVHILSLIRHINGHELNNFHPVLSHLEVINQSNRKIEQHISTLKSTQLSPYNLKRVNHIERYITIMNSDVILPLVKLVDGNDIDASNTLLTNKFDPLLIEYIVNYKALELSFQSGNDLYFNDSTRMVLKRFSVYLIILGIVILMIMAFMFYMSTRQKYALLQNIIDSVEDPLYVKNNEGHFVFANQLAADLYYTTPQEMFGRDEQFFDEITAEVTSRIDCERDVLSKFKKLTVEESRTDPVMGDVYHYQTIRVPFRGNNNLSFIVVVSRDITEKYKLKRASEHNEKRLKAVLNVSKEGVWDWNARSNETSMDLRCKEILGIFESEDLYESFIRSVHPTDKIMVEKAIQNLVMYDKPYDIKCRIIKTSGELVWVWDRCVVIERDSFGEAIWVVGILQDITQHNVHLNDEDVVATSI